MARKKKHEEHVNAEAWAIPYGDLVTLLFALFTVMYAMSSVNEGKFRVLSDSMIAAFHGAPKSMQPINIGQKQQGKGGDKQLVGVTPTALMKIASQKGLLPGAALAPAPGADPATAAPRVDGHAADGKGAGESDMPGGALIRMERQVQEAMQALIDEKLVSVRREDMWLEIEINTDILFPSGSGNFSGNAEPILDKLADVLKPFPNPIRVEGHTDNRPIHSGAFPSNWELSAARAASVVHQFMKQGVDPQRLQIVGYGEFHPKQSNDTAEGRNANRRVAVLVLEELSPPAASAAKDATSQAGPPSEATPSGIIAPVLPATRATAAGGPAPTNTLSSAGKGVDGEKTVLIKEHTAPPKHIGPVELIWPGQPAEGSAPPPPPAHHE